MEHLNRRDFLSFTFGGVVVLSSTLVSPAAAFARSTSTASSSACRIDFDVTSETLDMVDGEVVPVWAFSVVDCAGMDCTGVDVRQFTCRRPVPGPVIRVQEGQTLTITIRNFANRRHGFAIPGIPGARIPGIREMGSGTVTFTVPDNAAGTYMYLDPLNAPVNRLLGLHGAFIVLPVEGRTLEGAPTPYARARHRRGVRALFNALGDAAPRPQPNPVPYPGHPHRFPGHGWQPADLKRDVVWLWNQIDPAVNERAITRDRWVSAASLGTFLPRYFTLNGRSGFFAAHDEETALKGAEGESTLIRNINAGLACHSPHIHGNHVFELAASRSSGAVVPLDNVVEKDTWTLHRLAAPGNRVNPNLPWVTRSHIKDVLLPFERPPDVPTAAWPPVDEPFPLRYVMHCHTEMSQTAAGGLYPQGSITDWELEHALGEPGGHPVHADNICPNGTGDNGGSCPA